MLTPGATAEYGRTQERVTIMAMEGRWAHVQFYDGRVGKVFASHLTWVPSEAEIAEGAERIRAANTGLRRPTQSEWDFAINDFGDGA